MSQLHAGQWYGQAMRGGELDSGVAQDNGGHNVDPVDERSSRLLSMASGVAVAVGVAALGLAVVADNAGLSGSSLAHGEPDVPAFVAPAARQVNQVDSPADIAAQDRVVRVNVERAVPEPEVLPASSTGVAADDAPARHNGSEPAQQATTGKGSASKKPVGKDGVVNDSAGTKNKESASKPSGTAPGGGAEDSKPGKEPAKESHGGNSQWWDGSEAIWDWGNDSRWSEHLLNELSRWIPETRTDTRSGKNSDSEKSTTGSHKRHDG